MIVGVQKLTENCRECNKRADFMVKRICRDPSKEEFKEGTRNEYYCKNHLPKGAKALWNSFDKEDNK